MGEGGLLLNTEYAASTYITRYQVHYMYVVHGRWIYILKRNEYVQKHTKTYTSDHTLAIINHRQSDGTQRPNRHHRQTTWPRDLKALSRRPAAAAAAREVSTFRSSQLKLH